MNDTTLQIGQYGRIPLDQIIIGPNVRKTVILGKEFIADVRDAGVRVPVLVYPATAEEGKFAVHDGQRRLLAAIEHNHADIPAVVIPEPVTLVDRITEQLAVNAQRAALVDADEASAITELDGLGVTAAQVARKTHLPKDRITKAFAVSGSAVAKEAIATTAITLDQAAALTEFEDDPEATARLVAVAVDRPSNFDHAAEQLRTARRKQAAVEGMEQELAQAGYRVIGWTDSTSAGSTREVSALYTDEKLKKRLANSSATRLPIETPGLAAMVTSYYSGPAVKFVIEDWQSNGFHAPTNTSGNAGGLTDEEKAKRKAVRDNNKLWQPATIVRRQWISELLQRKELPADALEIAARYFGALPNFHYSQRAVLADLLGANGSGAESITRLLVENPKRSLAVLVAGALTAIEGEQDFGKDGWRRGSAKAHLERLSSWGYTLSDIEQAVVAGTADKGVAA